MKNQYSILTSESPRNGWEEIIKDEIEKHGQSDNSIPDFLTMRIMIGPGN